MVISEIVGRTVNDFLDYAIVVATLLVIYYIIKFFLVAPPTKEEREKETEARRKAWGEWWEGRSTKSKQQEQQRKQLEQKKKKKELISPVKEYIKDALEAGEAAYTSLAQGERQQAQKNIKKANEQIDKAWKNLQVLRRKLDGAEKDHITGVITDLHAIQEEFLRKVNEKLPKKLTPATKAAWDAAVQQVLPVVKKIIGSLGSAWKKLEEFHR